MHGSYLDISPGVEYNRITVAFATDHKKEVFFLHSDPNTLTEGSIWKKMLLFALPILLGNIFQQFYNAFDTWVVGKFIGSTALAAVSSSSSLIFMFVGFFNGVAMGAGVIIARYYGARDYKQVRIAIHTDVAFGLVAGSILTVLGVAFSPTILRWMNTPESVLPQSVAYFRFYFCGAIFTVMYNIFVGILHAVGDSKHPLYYLIFSTFVNIVLDLVLVAAFHMEVFGAALATVISQGLSFIVALIYLYRHKESFGFDFRLRSFAIDKPALMRLLALGIPMAIQSAAINISKIILTSWINLHGVVYSALSGIYNKINTMIGIVSNSFTTAGSTMVGQNLGARKHERVPVIMRTVILCTGSIATILALALIFASEPIFALFTTDEAVLSTAYILVIPAVLNFYGSATRSMSFSLINGSGNTRLNFAVAIIDGMISRVGIAALLGFALGMGCEGFWYGDALAGFMPFVIGMCYFFSGKWKKR